MLGARLYTFRNCLQIESLKPQGKLASGSRNVGWKAAIPLGGTLGFHELVLYDGLARANPRPGPAAVALQRLTIDVSGMLGLFGAIGTQLLLGSPGVGGWRRLPSLAA